MRLLFSFLFILISSFTLFSQIDESKRYSEEEVAIETSFLEATRLQLLNEFEDAITVYKNLIKKDPNNAVIHFQLSRCYEATKDFTNAVKSGQKAVDLDDSNEFFVMQLAESFEAQEDYQNTALTYLSYTKQDPTEVFFYERAIFFFLMQGEFDSALETLNKLEKALGINESVTRQKFEIYSKQGNEKKAIKELSKLCKEYPNKERYKLNLANYYTKIGEYKKAKTTFEEVLKLNPGNKEVAEYLAQGNKSGKQSALKIIASEIPVKSISIDLKLSKIIPHLNRLVENYNEDLASELLMVSNKLIQTYPDDPRVHALQGDIFMNSGNVEQAIISYQKTLKMNGSVFDVWYQLMVALRETNNIEELFKTSDNAILRFPNQGIAYLFNGYALNKQNKPKEAFSVFQEAMLFIGSNDNLRKNLKTEMARSKFLLSEYAAAEKILSSEEISTASAFELYGDILFKKNDIDKALALWSKALVLEPHNKELSDKIAQKQL